MPEDKKPYKTIDGLNVYLDGGPVGVVMFTKLTLPVEPAAKFQMSYSYDPWCTSLDELHHRRDETIRMLIMKAKEHLAQRGTIKEEKGRRVVYCYDGQKWDWRTLA